MFAQFVLQLGMRRQMGQRPPLHFSGRQTAHEIIAGMLFLLLLALELRNQFRTDLPHRIIKAADRLGREEGIEDTAVCMMRRRIRYQAVRNGMLVEPCYRVARLASASARSSSAR